MDDDRNIVLLTVDSLRADRCGFMGSEKDLTPTLDGMADDGLVFENAIAPATTTSGSVPAFLTGEHLPDKEFFSESPSRREWIRTHLRAAETLPERLSRRGYETAAFTTNPWTSRYYGFDEVFDHFEDFMDEDVTSGAFAIDSKHESAVLSLASQVLNWWQGQDMFMTWEAFYDDVVSWIEEAEQPYFLWLFLVDVHVPYIPPPGYRSGSRLRNYLANARLYAGSDPEPGSWAYETLVQSYEDTIEYTDAFVDQLTSDLRGDPLFFFQADHGEELNENGYFGHRNVYEGAVHVPMLVANGPTGRVREPFSLLDIPSLVESLRTGGGYDHLTSPYALTRNYDPQLAVRGVDWKFVRCPDGEAVFDVRDGSDDPMDAADLRAVGRDVIDAWMSDERERVRIRESTQSSDV